MAAAREFRLQLQHERIVLVADFGGGTSDYTIVRLGPKPYDPKDVLAVGGVPIAGDVLDGAVMRNRIAAHFGADIQYKVPFGSNTMTMPSHLVEKLCSPAELSVLRKQDTMQFLRNVQQWSLGPKDRKIMDQLLLLIEEQLGFGIFEEIEKVKRGITDAKSCQFTYEYPGVSISEKITAKQFGDYIAPSVEKILSGVDETLKRAGIKASQVDVLCCTGGTANVGLIQKGLADRFGADKLKQHKQFHSVVEGLAERAREVALIS